MFNMLYLYWYTGIQFVDSFCKKFVLIVLLIVQIRLIYTKKHKIRCSVMIIMNSYICKIVSVFNHWTSKQKVIIAGCCEPMTLWSIVIMLPVISGLGLLSVLILWVQSMKQASWKRNLLSFPLFIQL